MPAANLHRRPAIALVLLLLVAGSAGAFWQASGGGAAQVRLADVRALTISGGATSALLAPGGTTDVALVVQNSNPFSIRLERLVLDLSMGTNGFGVDGEHAGCDVGALSFTAQENDGAGWVVPPRTGDTDGAVQISLTGALAMSTDASSACQGAAFTVNLAAAPFSEVPG